MSKRRSVWNESVYQKRLAEGRGQGEGSEYKPWILVHDFASRGVISRIAGSKTGRTHHLMSTGEKNYFYLLEWSDEVTDIREQFPLADLELALRLASEAGIRYPRDSVSAFPYVLTCDFMVRTKDGFKARTVKSSSALDNTRTLEKLEIERRYWVEKGIDWKIVTEQELPIVKIRNIEWLHSASKPPVMTDSAIVMDDVCGYCRKSDVSIYDAAAWAEIQYGLPKGMGLQLVKHLMWRKRIPWDMNRAIPETTPHTALQ